MQELTVGDLSVAGARQGAVFVSEMGNGCSDFGTPGTPITANSPATTAWNGDTPEAGAGIATATTGKCSVMTGKHGFDTLLVNGLATIIIGESIASNTVE